jgi:prevent-host-death family protein
MQSWSVQVAKAHFSGLLATCETSGPQLVTRRGEPAAVLVPIAEWRKLSAKKPPTLKELLRTSKHPRAELER